MPTTKSKPNTKSSTEAITEEIAGPRFNHSPHGARYLDKRGAAALFSVSPRTVDVWMAKRMIPFFKLGKNVFFDPSDIDAHLKAHCRVASSRGFATLPPAA